MPELVWPEIGHAHVLLFRNRLREARALYLKNKGKGKFVDGSTWEEVIADGFRELRRAGLAHPMMREVEVALDVAPTQVSQSAAADAHRAVLVGEGGATPPPAPPTSSPIPTHAKKKVTTPDWRTNFWSR